MTERDVIERTSAPITPLSLADDLRALGVEPGMTLLVHSSLSALGWVCGGPQAVVMALQAALGPEGTLAMPTHSGERSDPALWQHPGPVGSTQSARPYEKTSSGGSSTASSAAISSSSSLGMSGKC